MEPSQFMAGSVRFVCEQDGVGERTLKNAVSARLEAAGIVGRAYLMRVDYGNGDEFNVALCLRVLSGDARVATETASRTFHQLFSTEEHLDVLVLTEEQEQVVQSVAKGFRVGPS
jgi:hypothetical protein